MKWEKEDGEEFVSHSFIRLEMTNILASALLENKGSILEMEKQGLTHPYAGLCADLNSVWQGIRREEFDEFVSCSKASCSARFE